MRGAQSLVPTACLRLVSALTRAQLVAELQVAADHRQGHEVLHRPALPSTEQQHPVGRQRLELHVQAQLVVCVGESGQCQVGVRARQGGGGHGHTCGSHGSAGAVGAPGPREGSDQAAFLRDPCSPPLSSTRGWDLLGSGCSRGLETPWPLALQSRPISNQIGFLSGALA